VRAKPPTGGEERGQERSFRSFWGEKVLKVPRQATHREAKKQAGGDVQSE
jgi:hypothetical protein